jgi:hypothetical protein
MPLVAERERRLEKYLREEEAPRGEGLDMLI